MDIFRRSAKELPRDEAPAPIPYTETRKGYPETLTVKERGDLAQLRAQLEAEGILVKGNRWDDNHELCRWLRARQFTLPKVMTMIHDHLEWERSFDVDTLFATFKLPDPQSVKEAYPRVYHKTDRVGRPINIDMIGRIDIAKVNRAATMEQMVKDKVWEMEHTLRVKYPACSRIAGRTINQSFVIMDLKGLGMSTWNAQTRAMLKQLTGILSDHYPETMGALFIVNAPAFFTAIWSVAQVFLDPGTKKKITILGSNFQKQLAEHVDPANLPPFLGGTDTTFDSSKDQGPWLAMAEEAGELNKGRRWAARRTSDRRTSSARRVVDKRSSTNGVSARATQGTASSTGAPGDAPGLSSAPPPPPPPRRTQRRRGFLCCTTPLPPEEAEAHV